MSNVRGLATEEAARRLVAHGPNEIEKPQTRGFWTIVRGTFREPMFLLLLAGAVLYLLIGDLGEGVFLIAGASVSIGLVILQEVRSEGALKALRGLAQPYAHVVRDGRQLRLPARELVPGDLILVGEGERVPADAALTGGDVLSIDESLLTGESAPVARFPDQTAGDGEASRIFAGTLVVRGAGSAIVQSTGSSTRFGRIGASLAGDMDESTPLQKTARRLIGYLAIAATAFAVVVFVAYGLVRNDWFQGGLTAITVAISLLPEEFPMVLAIFLALGAWRLARHNVLVRRAAAIEALGGATLLCVDKTGTLTRNQMKLARAWAAGQAYDIAPAGPGDDRLKRLLSTAALASGVRSVDPMDRAILELASVEGDVLADQPTRSWPLRPERLAVIQVWRGVTGDIAAAKGAPETIFRMCRLSEGEIAVLHGVLEAMAADGLRVLGVARANCVGDFPPEPDQAKFELAGLIGFIDPLRADVEAALREARAASISVAMITGDHPSTALATARAAGIDSVKGVLAGSDIDGLDPETFRRRIQEVRVFARIAPEQKLRLVQAFRANGEVVVMTGDGVNDAPALKAADIGIAMGKRGSDVARESADIVLLDDSFASIVGGVRLGRRIFANLRKALVFITAVHVPIAGLALIPILLGWPPLFLPMHVVLLELVIDPVCSLVFEAEPSESRAMRRPPRRPDEMLFGPQQFASAVLQGAVVLLSIAIFYGWSLSAAPEPEARGAAFASLVIANLVLALADSSGGRAGLFDRSHTAFWFIVVAAVGVLAAVLYFPPLADILHVAPADPVLMVTGFAVAAAAGGWPGVLKALRSRRSIERAG
jgi:Ca2+-transporting ATPase